MPLGSKEFRQELFTGNVATHIDVLARQIGPRSMAYDPRALQLAEGYLISEWSRMGFKVDIQPLRRFSVSTYTAANLQIEIPGNSIPDELVIIGAHFDSVVGTFPGMPVLVASPGANDNASGVAAMLELSRYFSEISPERTLRFVAFTNEEPPYTGKADMGSFVYTHKIYDERDRIKSMMSIDEIGYYTDKPGTQSYPPDVEVADPSDIGNFVAFVSNPASLNLTRESQKVFAANTDMSSKVIWTRYINNEPSLPITVGPRGPFIRGLGADLKASFLAASDHGFFWGIGVEAFCVTDTSVFRYPAYHDEADTPERVDNIKIAQITNGLIPVIEHLTKQE